MIAASTRSRHARRVLKYLATMEKICRKQGNRELAGEYFDAWKLLCDVIYGAIPRPYHLAHSFNMEYKPGPRLVPGWKRKMLSKPLRRVVRVYQKRVEEKHPYPAADLTMEVLECGHEQVQVSGIWGNRPAKRRRCAQCAKPMRATIIEIAKAGAVGA